MPSTHSGDETDPLQHFKSYDSDIVPEQPAIQKGTIHLNFPDSQTIALSVDGSPGCGGNVWLAGRVLSEYLVYRYQSLHGKRILELGAGTGLVGLVAAKLGGEVVLTDQLPLLPIMRSNIELNGLGRSVSAVELNWGEPLPPAVQSSSQFSIILAADCVYLESAFPLLVKTLDDLYMGNLHAEVLFCYRKRRKADKRFFALLRKKFSWTEVDDDPRRQVYNRERVTLLRLLHRT
ncbi:putative methyltransferase-domain-containing protein [Cantharellus anzutake]|uniref:putative methyltransferase-domain-containing protein n=1 Tax=Cantharellus anzutake TaxID=1750568 RepID=UPI0019085BE4|nr:putative methyltransferase-domain-containing protein [Cantharellus anzutake]KAF8324432.1 putative methyltransferase-domain-containing protein [Cantharellus anzutake]